MHPYLYNGKHYVLYEKDINSPHVSTYKCCRYMFLPSYVFCIWLIHYSTEGNIVFQINYSGGSVIWMNSFNGWSHWKLYLCSSVNISIWHSFSVRNEYDLCLALLGRAPSILNIIRWPTGQIPIPCCFSACMVYNGIIIYHCSSWQWQTGKGVQTLIYVYWYY